MYHPSDHLDVDPNRSPAADTYRLLGEPVPWEQNWHDGQVVPRGDGGILDTCTLFEAGDERVFQRPWTDRERRRILPLLQS